MVSEDWERHRTRGDWLAAHSLQPLWIPASAGMTVVLRTSTGDYKGRPYVRLTGPRTDDYSLSTADRKTSSVRSMSSSVWAVET